MQVTDIDSGTSLSIQALEQSGCCEREKKNASKKQTQYSERCEMTTRVLSSVSEPRENSILFVFFVITRLAFTRSAVCLQRGSLS